MVNKLKQELNMLLDDPFENFEEIEQLENKIINMLHNKINNKTCKFVVNNKTYYILHKSTKKNNTIQVTCFYKDQPFSDAEYNNYKDALKDLLYYELAEVV